jgi:hypothetical protein
MDAREKRLLAELDVKIDAQAANLTPAELRLYGELLTRYVADQIAHGTGLTRPGERAERRPHHLAYPAA